MAETENNKGKSNASALEIFADKFLGKERKRALVTLPAAAAGITALGAVVASQLPELLGPQALLTVGAAIPQLGTLIGLNAIPAIGVALPAVALAAGVAFGIGALNAKIFKR